MTTPIEKGLQQASNIQSQLKSQRAAEKPAHHQLPTIDNALGIYYSGVKDIKSKPKNETPYQRAIPPWKKAKDYVLTKRETKMYKHISKVYRDDTKKGKQKRQTKFYRKLEDLQEEQYKRDAVHYQEMKTKEEETKQEHLQQLKRLRSKFQDEQTKRFMSQ